VHVASSQLRPLIVEWMHDRAALDVRPRKQMDGVPIGERGASCSSSTAGRYTRRWWSS